MPHAGWEQNATGPLCAVFVHGILGNPNQFAPLLPQVPPPVQIRQLILPGHGGSGREFAQSSAAAWQACLDDCLQELRAAKQEAVIIAHSLGCLLALQAALANPQGIRALFLVAPALLTRLKLRAQKPTYRQP